MLKSSIKLLTHLTKTSLKPYTIQSFLPIHHNNAYSFCKTNKHESNQKHKQEKTKESHQEEIEKNKHKDKHQNEKHYHQHGPNCTHEHQHQYRKPKHTHHQHGPGCNHEHDHLHQAHVHTEKTHINVQLSKLSFEQLVEIPSDDALKYAEKIYEQEQKKFKELQEQKESALKSIELYQKADEEMKEKELKLAENIKSVEEEIASAKKRADKQIQESKAFAVSKIARQLLQVADCIASCKKYAQGHQIQDQYIQNMSKSQTIIKQILNKFQIEEFDPTNQQYDANTQQSLVNVPTPPGYKPNHVAMTMRTGYTIKGRLLRSARVGVFC